MEAGLLLYANAFLLGLRHGFDWDHLAAISDIVGTVQGAAVREPVTLSTAYIVGHAAVVMLLGTSVIIGGNFLPPWVEGIAPKFVGATLILLGTWLAWTLVRDAGARAGHAQPLRSPRRYGVATTFGVGMIHGIGAETGTQMLLLASIGGAGNTFLALGLLLTFVIGLLISNSAIAAAGIAGFTASRYKQLSNWLGAAAAAFSVFVGLNLLR